MPGLAEVRTAARAVGALGTVISGAGPTLAAVCDGEAVARQVCAAMTAVYARLALPCATSVAQPSARGATWRAV
jgi:homoserine kinase